MTLVKGRPTLQIVVRLGFVVLCSNCNVRATLRECREPGAER